MDLSFVEKRELHEVFARGPIDFQWIGCQRFQLVDFCFTQSATGFIFRLVLGGCLCCIFIEKFFPCQHRRLVHLCPCRFLKKEKQQEENQRMVEGGFHGWNVVLEYGGT